MNYTTLLHALGIVVVLSPTLLFVVLGIASFLETNVSERWIGRLTQIAVTIGLVASLAILALMLVMDTRRVPIEIGNWAVIDAEHYHYKIEALFDRLSVPFVILTFVLCGTIAAFTTIYLHHEQGYRRFFILYAMFLLGMIITSVAGTIEMLFLGWELVGLSSALLVGFFHDRSAPVRNGLRIWSVYRVADASFLIAVLTLHHLTGGGDFGRMVGEGSWPAGQSSLSSGQALFVGVLLLIAAAGKSGLIPFSGWLPRAMEGPTPSSAVFYGALSVHLGAFLLLRVSPILEASTWLCAAVVALGLLTALFAAIAARVQSDIKSALAFASLTQVGIIVAEIGFGLRYLALIHIIGHACLRTLQLLRAPTLLRDYHVLENAIGSRLAYQPGFWVRVVPERFRIWVYRMALERGYFDALLNVYVVEPFRRVFQWCDKLEGEGARFLSGESEHTSNRLESHPETLEDFL